jgi:hypothetical protein
MDFRLDFRAKCANERKATAWANEHVKTALEADTLRSPVTWTGPQQNQLKSVDRLQVRMDVAERVFQASLWRMPETRAQILQKKPPHHLYEYFFDGAAIPARVIGAEKRASHLTIASLHGNSCRIHEARLEDLCIVPPSQWLQHIATIEKEAPNVAGVFTDPLGMLLLVVD